MPCLPPSLLGLLAMPHAANVVRLLLAAHQRQHSLAPSPARRRCSLPFQCPRFISLTLPHARFFVRRVAHGLLHPCTVQFTT